MFTHTLNFDVTPGYEGKTLAICKETGLFSEVDCPDTGRIRAMYIGPVDVASLTYCACKWFCLTHKKTLVINTDISPSDLTNQLTLSSEILKIITSTNTISDP